MNQKTTYIIAEASEAVVRIAVLAAAFATPLLVVRYGYSSSVIQQTAFAGLALFGWVALLAGRVFGGSARQLRFSRWEWIFFGLSLLTLASAFFGGNTGRSFGLDSRLVPLGSITALSAFGYALLVSQYCRGVRERRYEVLAAYFAGSTLLALLTLGWWLRFGELVSFWDGGPAAQSLWFAVNSIVLLGLCMRLAKAPRRFWGVVLALHLALLAAYDFDAGWYVLFGGAATLFGIEYSLQRRITVLQRLRDRFVWLLGVSTVAAVLLIAPVGSLVPGFGMQYAGGTQVRSMEAVSELFTRGGWRRILLGAGAGAGVEEFWNLAEYIDMRSFNAAPVFGTLAATVLWDGGFLFLLGMAMALLLLAWLGIRGSADSGSPFVSASLGAGMLALLAAAACMPASFAWFFSFAVFGGLSVPPSAPRAPGMRRAPRAAAAAALLGGLVFLSAAFAAGSVMRVQWKAAATAAATVADNRVSLDYPVINSLADAAGPVSEYRLLRAELSARTVAGALSQQEDTTPEVFASGLETLAQDFRLYALHESTGAAYWRMAAAAEQLKDALASREPIAASSDPALKALMDPATWRALADTLYGRAQQELPANQILRAEVARFSATR